MLKLINFEIKKAFSGKISYIILILIAVLIGLYSLIFEKISYDKLYDYSVGLLAETKNAQNGINLNSTSDTIEIQNIIDASVNKIAFCVENNIPVNSSNVWFFMEKINMLYLVIIIGVLLLLSRIYYVELRDETLTRLFFSKCGFLKILISKIIATFIISIGSVFFIYFCSFMLGLLRFGFNGNVLKTVVELNGQFEIVNIIRIIIYQILVILLQINLYVSFFVLLITITKSDKLSLILIALWVFFNNNISLMLNNKYLEKLLPFKALSFGYKELLEKETSFIVVMLVFTIMFYILSIILNYYLGNKKEKYL